MLQTNNQTNMKGLWQFPNGFFFKSSRTGDVIKKKYYLFIRACLALYFNRKFLIILIFFTLNNFHFMFFKYVNILILKINFKK
jgi:hypothetical protein